MANKTRRRGEELKIALYEATFKIIQTDGIHAVTFGKIAKEAETSSSVLYRYWESPFDLMFDTIKYLLNKEESSQKVFIFNQGSLREDLIYVASFLSMV
ncbi:TetR/AcrR family transcriptional regulator [Listeria aquatica]|uniref:TetR/AcrR family transcriptional regulator n=1 Tax=Listeria aquatica TaxID=1494960 RepID=UPI0031F4A50F